MNNQEVKPVVSKNKVDNQIIVIFGSTGDLSKRKLVPAIFQLYIDNLLPESFALLGAGSKKMTDEDFRAYILESLIGYGNKCSDGDNKKKCDFVDNIYYQQVNNREKDDFIELKNRLFSISKDLDIPPNYIYYYSIPPFLYDCVSDNLLSAGLTNEDEGWKRVIVEKPFGYSYDTAVELDDQLHNAYKEKQIYRIDHYLGKETVQNITVTRFANSFFEPLWNQRYIEKVEIKSAENIGVGSRGGYYDTSGALRDMIQNHLLQVLAVIAMEPPSNFEADSIHAEKVKVFQALRPILEADVKDSVIRAQYVETNVNDMLQKGYLQEEGVAADSKTETFCALKLFIDNWRWSGVPFVITTGKQMPERLTEVRLHLKPAPLLLFKDRCYEQSGNMIILRIQPDESVSICFGMKKPGAGYKVQDVLMDFEYSDLADTKIPEAYERLLLDCMIGDSTLYPRADALKLSWKFLDPILKAFQNQHDLPMYTYSCNTWGPLEASALLGGLFKKWSPVIKK